METILEKLFNLNKEECFIDKCVVVNVIEENQEVCLELVNGSSFQMLQFTWLFHKAPVLKVCIRGYIFVFKKRMCLYLI